MYIPPYDAVLQSAGTSREELKDAAEVTIPMGLFKFLMQLAVANGDFNEAGYLKANPDVAEAVERGDDLLALDEALDRLAAVSERSARVVECRFFGGMSVEETAEALGTSPATVKRDWTVARAWLNRELGE